MHYKKLDGSKNTSDILTKPVEAEIMGRHMTSLGFEFRSGRNPLTPALVGRRKACGSWICNFSFSLSLVWKVAPGDEDAPEEKLAQGRDRRKLRAPVQINCHLYFIFLFDM